MYSVMNIICSILYYNIRSCNIFNDYNNLMYSLICEIFDKNTVNMVNMVVIYDI